MLVKEKKLLDNVQKQLKCRLGSCIEHITLTISDNDIKFLHIDDQWYKGVCSKCTHSVKVKASDLHTFQRLMGNATVVVAKSTLSKTDLFE